jgi:lipopolysaccharide biosynthesis protein
MNDYGSKIHPIAVYLPQFHPIPENDKWWGKGFTEWTNVAKAKPLFKGHYQPHLPADLGFYDLRVQETREAQAQLARQYGIYGFCYYHYWFNGKRLLDRPLDDMLKTKTPDFPFMICWANENWTRRWDGQDKEVLMMQEYSAVDDKNHIQFLLKNFFSDPRYIRVNNKPFFLIYRPKLFPDIKKTLECWRDEARKFGFDDLYIGYTYSYNFKEPPENYGFDCAVEFQPDFSGLPPKIKPGLKERLINKLHHTTSDYSKNLSKNKVVSYPEYVDKIIKYAKIDPRVYKMVTPMWDNSARRQKGAVILSGSTPALYEKWLRHTIKQVLGSQQAEKFIFINAWNEWAEGNHLEPCQKWGRQYLEATKNALNDA